MKRSCLSIRRVNVTERASIYLFIFIFVVHFCCVYLSNFEFGMYVTRFGRTAGIRVQALRVVCV